ncbi:translation initiation factor IF-2 [Bubalus bubalis]|uniref:translation initiation factor IF-2 n=1 Tax=Bubalus bubalis TaxID=89462 RepID=UPI001D10AF58|nr:translation initiation factor IF-2 [Bubalus bubalis]
MAALSRRPRPRETSSEKAPRRNRGRAGAARPAAATTRRPRPTAGRRRVVSGPRGRAPRPARPSRRPGTPRPAQPSPLRGPRGRSPGPARPAFPYPVRPGKETGNTRRRRLYSPGRPLRVAAAAVAQVPSRRPAGNGRLRGGAAPARPGVWAPAVPGDRPLKGTGVAASAPARSPAHSGTPTPRVLPPKLVSSCMALLPKHHLAPQTGIFFFLTLSKSYSISPSPSQIPPRKSLENEIFHPSVSRVSL